MSASSQVMFGIVGHAGAPLRPPRDADNPVVVLQLLEQVPADEAGGAGDDHAGRDIRPVAAASRVLRGTVRLAARFPRCRGPGAGNPAVAADSAGICHGIRIANGRTMPLNACELEIDLFCRGLRVPPAVSLEGARGSRGPAPGSAPASRS